MFSSLRSRARRTLLKLGLTSSASAIPASLPRSCVEAEVAGLQSGASQEVRVKCAEALSRSPRRESIEALAFSAANHREVTPVRRAAIAGLQLIAREPIFHGLIGDELCHALKGGGAGAFRKSFGAATDLLPALACVLGSIGPSARWAAPRLRELCATKWNQVELRPGLIGILERIEGPQAARPFLKLVGLPYASDQSIDYAAEALGYFRGAEARATIRASLKRRIDAAPYYPGGYHYPESEVRAGDNVAKFMEVLAAHGGDESIELLVHALGAKHYMVSLGATRMLAKLRSEGEDIFPVVLRWMDAHRSAEHWREALRLGAHDRCPDSLLMSKAVEALEDPVLNSNLKLVGAAAAAFTASEHLAGRAECESFTRAFSNLSLPAKQAVLDHGVSQSGSLAFLENSLISGIQSGSLDAALATVSVRFLHGLGTRAARSFVAALARSNRDSQNDFSRAAQNVSQAS